MNHITSLWTQFSKRALPTDTSDKDLIYMRRCFFAGASLLFSKVTEKIDDPTISSYDGAKFMGEISKEIDDFARNVTNGVS